jgi:hypothetical protein
VTQFIDDVSSLDDLDLGEGWQPTEDEPYETVKAPTRRGTPPKGRYNLQLPDEIKVGAWPKSDKGPGSIELSMPVVKVVAPGEPFDGEEMRYINVSTRRIGKANASSATDLLQRVGMEIPRSAVEWATVAQHLSGAIVEGVYCDWECRAPKDTDPNRIRAFLKDKGIEVTDPRAKKILIRGMDRFPKGTDGAPLSYLYFEQGPDGQPLKLYANLKPTLRGFGLTQEEAAG